MPHLPRHLLEVEDLELRDARDDVEAVVLELRDRVPDEAQALQADAVLQVVELLELGELVVGEDQVLELRERPVQVLSDHLDAVVHQEE